MGEILRGGAEAAPEKGVKKMERIETKNKPGRPRKWSRAAVKTISVDLEKYEEISAEAERMDLSFFEFVDMLYRAYAADQQKEIVKALRDLKEIREELEKLKKENEDLRERLERSNLRSKESTDLVSRDSMISEMIDLIDEFKPRFETDIQLSQSGELSLKKEILRTRRDLFRKRETEYMKLKNKLEAAGIHDIDPKLAEFEKLMLEAKKALGISADKAAKNKY